MNRLLAGMTVVLLVAGCGASPAGDPTPEASNPRDSSSIAPPTSSPTSTPTAWSETCADEVRVADGRIVFTVSGGAANSIATIDADGSGFRRIVEPGPGQQQRDTGNDGPRWLPDGRILFNRADKPDDWHLYVVGADGGEPEQLTSGRDGIEGDGAMSPDGSTLAYQKVVATGDASEPLREAGIFLSDPNGGDERQLTTVPEGGVDELADFSPDGLRVAFSRALAGEPGSHRGSIWVVNVDGTGSQEITDPELDAIRPRWSPDGKLIVFSSNAENYESESANVWVVAADGTGLRQLTFQSGMSQAFFPDWSPDGRRLVFLRHRAGSGTQDLGIIDLNDDRGCTLWAGTSSQVPGYPDWGPPGA